MTVSSDATFNGWLYNNNNVSLKGGIYILNDRAVANYWQIYMAMAGTSNNSLIFQHINTGINSKWWFNGTQTNTQSEISDERIKKDIQPSSSKSVK